MAGTLFVVATPIGNLEDITLRALRVLREVDVIAAEDTRRTAKLLSHYKIDRPMTSLREHNEARASAALVERLSSGQSVALVSDAGTPGIADPGAKLVRLARDRGIAVVPIPGPSAVTAALSIAGFEWDEFVFMGYPPAGGAARTAWFRRAVKEHRPVVFYEAPHRISRTMAALGDYVVRPIFVGRELTKIHEQSVIRPSTAIQESDPERGEYVLVLGPGIADVRPAPDAALAAQLVKALEECAELPHDEALSFVAKGLDSEPNTIAKSIKKYLISVKQQSSPPP